MKIFDERVKLDFYYSNRNLYYWHLSRYEFATKFISKDDFVLDIACGSGYGSNLIGAISKKVFAVDIDKNVIEDNRKKYKNNNIEFINCNAINLREHIKEKVNVVISLETIEHLDEIEQNLFMKELKNIMNENAILIISTPNKTNYSPNTEKSNNPFHKHEMEKIEFEIFLHKYFEIVYLYGQKMFDGFPLKWIILKLASYLRRIKNPTMKFLENDIYQLTDFEIAPNDYDNSLYLIAVCKGIIK